MKTVPNKSDFVRSQKPGTPARDVVAAAKKKGIKLTERYVYVIRSSDKAKAKRGRGPGMRGRRGGGAETTLRSAIADVGLAAARKVLADVERAFAA